MLSTALIRNGRNTLGAFTRLNQGYSNKVAENPSFRVDPKFFKTYAITGTGDIALNVGNELKRKGHNVKYFGRNINSIQEDELTSFEKITSEKMKCQESWEKVFVNSDVDGVIHTIGKPSGTEEELEDANVKIALAAAKGFQNANSNGVFVQTSSVAAQLFKEGVIKCGYSKSKNQCEEELNELGGNISIVRIPLTLPNFQKKEEGVYVYSDKHAFGMEQIAKLPLPFFPILGDGNQPIPYVQMEDLTKLITEILEKNDSITVNAVSGVATQKEMAASYQKLVETNKPYVSLNPSSVEKIAEKLGTGHFQTYAVRGLDDMSSISSEELEELLITDEHDEIVNKYLGRSFKDMSEILTKPEDCKELIISKATKEFLKINIGIAKDPSLWAPALFAPLFKNN